MNSEIHQPAMHILIKRAPSWIQIQKRLGERQIGILESRSAAERTLSPNIALVSFFFTQNKGTEPEHPASLDLPLRHCWISYREDLDMSPCIMGLITQDQYIQKEHTELTKSLSFVLIGPILNKIQPFKNFKI